MARAILHDGHDTDPIDLRSVLDGMGEGFVLLDADFRVIDVNAEALRLEGRTREDIIGRSHWAIYPDAEHGPVGDLYRRAMRERLAGSIEAHKRSGGGKESWLDIRAYPVAPDRLAIFYRDVSERHIAAQKLRISEQRFHATTTALSDAIWTCDAKGRMVGEQPGWAALTGQSLAEYQGLGWTDALHPDDRVPTLRAWKAAVAANSLYKVEHRLRRHDGVWRIYGVRALPVCDDDGSVREWVGANVDISDLRASETRFRQLADNISACFFVHEVDERRTSYVSPAFEQIWHIKADELYADPMAFIRMIHPDDRAAVEAAMDRHRLGENTEVRYRLVRPDGSIRHIHDRAFVTRNPETDALRVVGIAEDVTATTEARLQLARNARTFEALVRGNPFGVYVVDSDLRIVQVSRGAHGVMGGIEPIIGRDLAEIQHLLWGEPMASDFVARFRHTMATGESFISHSTLARLRGPGMPAAFDWRLDRITLPDGTFGVVCYFYDLTERIALEQSLHKALADKDVLLREVDHRVRNSLSIVSALLGMQGKSSASDDVREALSVAASRIHAVSRIHDRLYKGKQVGVVEFGSYLETICHDLGDSLHQDDIRLEISTVPVMLGVGTAVSLGLIVNELVTNAFKHCGKSDAVITVTLDSDGQQLSLSVSDNGVGMPADYDQEGRAGLGTQVVNLLARQLHGKVEMPVAGGPAHFRIVMPIPH